MAKTFQLAEAEKRIEHLEGINRDLLAALEEAERGMDGANAQFGGIDQPGRNRILCLFCGTGLYSAEVGIEHSEHCRILTARVAIEKASQ